MFAGPSLQHAHHEQFTIWEAQSGRGSVSCFESSLSSLASASSGTAALSA
jgi:hypothetical protein